ncbi:hypothetical protein [Stutzerimonas chloritidismutans]
MNSTAHTNSDDQPSPDYDEYGDVPNSGDTTGTDERPDLDESPLG